MKLHLVHRSAPVAVSHRGGGFTGPIATDVLWRCPCGRLHTQTLVGKWELADVQGQVSPEATQQRSLSACS